MDKIELQRKTQSKGRKDFIRISLVGYTNAGKSTLFNLITRSGVLAENKLFATLDSTTRSLDIGINQKLLLSDTVGFIRKLPPNLIASFKSTLKEVKDADIILHVIDISHPYFEDHINVVGQTLKDLGADTKSELKVFNKIDIVNDKSRISYVRNKFNNAVIISAERGINISKFKEKLTSLINETYVEEKIELDLADSKTAAKIHSLAEVISTNYDDSLIHITYKTNRENSKKIKKMLNGA